MRKDKFELAKYNNLKSFEVEGHLFDKTLGLYKDFEETIDKYKGMYPVIEDLAKDMYVAILRKNPEFEPMEMVNPYSYMNRTLIETLTESIAFQASVNSVRNDLIATTYILPGILDYAMQQIIQSAGGEDGLKQIFKNFGKHGQGTGGGGGDKQGKGKGKKKESNEEIAKRLRETAEKLKKQVESTSLHVSQQIRDKMQIIRGMEEMKDMVSFGKEDASNIETDPNSRLKMAIKLLQNKDLVGLFNMLGRIRDALDKANTRSPSGISLHKTEIKPTWDISKAIGSELVYFSIPEMEDLPLMKAADNSILGYKHTSSGYKMGPIVICVDSSGSMMGEFDFWAKSVALCAAKHAISGGRTAHILLFSYSKEDMKEFVFSSAKKLPASKFIEFAKLCLAGGTDFECPLDRAREIIDSADKEMVHADIMFITDGYCCIEEKFIKKFNKFRKEKKVKVASFNVSDYECEDLKLISDFYKHMSEFREAQSANYASEILVQIPSPI